jgi:hypothetical protein
LQNMCKQLELYTVYTMIMMYFTLNFYLDDALYYACVPGDCIVLCVGRSTEKRGRRTGRTGTAGTRPTPDAPSHGDRERLIYYERLHQQFAVYYEFVSGRFICTMRLHQEIADSLWFVGGGGAGGGIGTGLENNLRARTATAGKRRTQVPRNTRPG